MSQVFDILVVEDDRFWHGALGRVLAPHRADFVQTVSEARQLLAARSYDGYVIDIKLRGYLVSECGIDLLDWARKRGFRAPALVITASDSREYANRAQKLGAALVYKPDVQANIARLLTDIAETRGAPSLSAQASDFARLHGLTPRQRQLVLALARGVPNGELAASLGVTGDALKALVRRTLRRTRATSCDELLRAIARHVMTGEQERARASKRDPRTAGPDDRHVDSAARRDGARGRDGAVDPEHGDEARARARRRAHVQPEAAAHVRVLGRPRDHMATADRLERPVAEVEVPATSRARCAQP